MAKNSVKFVCSSCGAQSSAWAGRCSQCGEWNTLQEEVQLVAAGGGDLKHSMLGLCKRLEVGVAEVGFRAILWRQELDENGAGERGKVHALNGAEIQLLDYCQ